MMRLRQILLKHVKELNPNANYDKIDALEDDINKFVRVIIMGVEDLGLEVKSSNFWNNNDSKLEK